MYRVGRRRLCLHSGRQNVSLARKISFFVMMWIFDIVIASLVASERHLLSLSRKEYYTTCAPPPPPRNRNRPPSLFRHSEQVLSCAVPWAKKCRRGNDGKLIEEGSLLACASSRPRSLARLNEEANIACDGDRVCSSSSSSERVTHRPSHRRRRRTRGAS